MISMVRNGCNSDRHLDKRISHAIGSCLLLVILSLITSTASFAKSVLVKQGSSLGQGTVIKMYLEAEEFSICHVISAAHILGDEKKPIQIVDQAGNFDDGEVVFADRDLDLVLIRIPGEGKNDRSNVCGSFTRSRTDPLVQTYPFKGPESPLWIDKITSTGGGLERTFFNFATGDDISAQYFFAQEVDEGLPILKGYSGAGGYFRGRFPAIFDRLDRSKDIERRNALPEETVGTFVGMLAGREGKDLRFLRADVIYERVLNHFEELDWNNVAVSPDYVEVLAKWRGLPRLPHYQIKELREESTIFWGLFQSRQLSQLKEKDANSILLFLDLGDGDNLINGIRARFESNIFETRRDKYNKFHQSETKKKSSLLRVYNQTFGGVQKPGDEIYIHQFRPVGETVFLPKTEKTHEKSKCKKLSRDHVEQEDEMNAGIKISAREYSVTCLLEDPKVGRGISLRIFGDVSGLREVEVIKGKL